MFSRLERKLFVLLLLPVLFGALTGVVVTRWTSPWIAVAIVASMWVVPGILLARYASQPVRRLLRALTGAIASYRDGDFSLSLIVDRDDELGKIAAAHNDLVQALRDQRQHIAQRELLLDTVMQSSPVALLLVDPAQYVCYCNLAARHLMNEGRKIRGTALSALLDRGPASLKEAFTSGVDGLFPVANNGTDETYHIAQRKILLQGRPHRLFLLKRLTRELSRQEVTIWKKLIRVLSHELNNSLAPISSLSHTGSEMVKRGQTDRLPDIFSSIAERSRHLHTFIDRYASFARLPAPRPEEISWSAFARELALHCSLTAPVEWPQRAGWFDPTQISQALINLLKNAHESGSSPDNVVLQVQEFGDTLTFTVFDRGSGMSEVVLANALLPFYSTKRTGTGLGLPLAREIAEAHDGNIAISNRDGGGSWVRMTLPNALVNKRDGRESNDALYSQFVRPNP